MDLRLLGPFEVLHDGVPQPLPGRGERALLAVLALAVPDTVAATTLIQQLWLEQELPDDPVNALQIRVSKLRRALAGMDAQGLVARHGSGYRLEVDASAVDAHRFAALMRAARRCGDPVEAIDLYDQALALWRADPLVDFAGEAWTTVDSVRLAELRLAAASERAERMLTLGRYEQLVGDLEPLVAEAPTREGLVAQLMTALFNAGRQAEALSAYSRTRQLLAEELGLDPSKELRTVMEQILKQDPGISRPASRSGTAAANGNTNGFGRRGPTGDGTGQGERREPVSSATTADTSVRVGNLPARSTSFVGRDDDLARTVDQLTASRLVTLAGPGGAGKTSLAIEAARAAAGEYPDGAWLVRLASVTEPEGVVHAVADALGLSIAGGTATHRPTEVLIGHLVGRRLMLVLDNCEHVIDPVASLTETLLTRCPDVAVVTTSREVLAVPGEVQLPVPPLATPPADSPTADVTDYAAARLFLDRARAVVPDLGADDDLLKATARICRRLDGIPLALELAAARLASLSATELAERVQDRFALLTSGNRTADARQRTLRNTVDWSHDLLTPEEQMLFRRLAIFRGGWTLTAAEAVVAGDGSQASAVMDLLDRLVAQSLVLVDHSTSPMRYRMLETLRQYAQEQLVASSEEQQLARSHADFFCHLADEAEHGLRGAGQAHWATVLQTEHANIRAALSRLPGELGDPDAALGLAGALGLYWHMGRHLEGRETLRSVMAVPGGSAPARARAMQAVALVERPRACLVHPSQQCAAAASESLRIFTDAADSARAAFSKLLLSVEGVALSGPAAEESAALLEEADREFADLGNDWGRAVAGFVRMEMLQKHGEELESREAAADATERFRALGDGWGLSAVLYHSGWGLSRFGRHAEAVPVLQEAIEVANRAGVYNTAQWATADLGLAHLALGQLDAAAECFDQAGTTPDQRGDEAGMTLGTYGEAVLLQERDEPGQARELFAAARVAFDRMGVGLATGLALAGVARCDEATHEWGQATEEYQELIRFGQSGSEYGLMATGLEGLARCELHAGDSAAAARLLGEAGWLRQSQDRPRSPHEVEDAAEAVRAARTALGAAVYETAEAEGEELARAATA